MDDHSSAVHTLFVAFSPTLSLCPTFAVLCGDGDLERRVTEVHGVVCCLEEHIVQLRNSHLAVQLLIRCYNRQTIVQGIQS